MKTHRTSLDLFGKTFRSRVLALFVLCVAFSGCSARDGELVGLWRSETNRTSVANVPDILSYEVLHFSKDGMLSVTNYSGFVGSKLTVVPPQDPAVPYQVVNSTSLVINLTFHSARGRSKDLSVPVAYAITNGELHISNWGGKPLKAWRVQTK
jgi:hypothetical protein